MSVYTHFDDPRLMRYLILNSPDFWQNTVDLVRGKIAWDWSDNDGYEEWQVTSSIRYLMTVLLQAGFGLSVNGPNATISSPFEYSLDDADRKIIKDQALGRRGIIFKLEHVCDHKDVPIYKANLFGRLCNDPTEWFTPVRFLRDVFILGRADVLRVSDRKKLYKSDEFVPHVRHDKMKRATTYGDLINYINVEARPTMRKAKNSVSYIESHIAKFDKAVAEDRSRKAARLAEKPWQPKFAPASMDGLDLITDLA